MPDQERRIVVEIFSHEAEQRLREEIKQLDDLYKADYASLDRRIQGLHRQLYELIEALGSIRSK